jgi:hypothetical protein
MSAFLLVEPTEQSLASNGPDGAATATFPLDASLR